VIAWVGRRPATLHRRACGLARVGGLVCGHRLRGSVESPVAQALT
jgi:hypothetical protein